MVFNFVTLFVFTLGEGVIFFRERYIINHFDNNPELHANNLSGALVHDAWAHLRATARAHARIVSAEHM